MSESQHRSTAGDTGEPATTRRRLRAGPLLLGASLGLVVVLIAVVAFVIVKRDRTPRLTTEAYEAAARRWDEHGPDNYNLDIELTGNRPGKVHVEVRDRQPVLMTRDGVEPRQERTWYYWTVPGQLDTIAQELEMAQDPTASFDSPQASQVVIWAEFDPKYGYPKRYDRAVLGTNYEIHWQVTNFEPLPEGASHPPPAEK
jgi:hypothetical protein